MTTRERFITIRESEDILKQVDSLAQAEGLDRSSLYRQTMRARLKMEADAPLERLRKYR